MSTKRFFIRADEVSDGKAEIRSAYNYIARVLRSRVGDEITLCVEDGRDLFSRITAIDASVVYCDVISSQVGQNESPFDCALFFGVLKGDKNDFVVQKAVELGANRIVLFNSRYSVSDVTPNKLERLKKICVSACEQCGRSKVPTVEYAENVSKAVSLLNEYKKILFCYENENTTFITSALNKDDVSLALVVGSEGGFDEKEALAFCQSGGKSVSLGKRILRAETASVFALSVVDAFMEQR